MKSSKVTKKADEKVSVEAKKAVEEAKEMAE